jgi:hypothetical protein
VCPSARKNSRERCTMALDAVYGAGLNEFPPRPGTLTNQRLQPTAAAAIMGPLRLNRTR